MRLLKLFFTLFFIFGAMGCTQHADSTMGTGTAVLIGGGGDYVAIINRIKASVRWTLNEIATKPNVAATVCESRDSLTTAQREYLRQIIRNNASTAAANLGQSQVEFTDQSLFDQGSEVRATVEKASLGYKIRIRESSYRAGEAWYLLVHEILHTAANLNDRATPPVFPTGLRAGLDIAGQCVEDLWLRLSNPAEMDPSFGTDGFAISTGHRRMLTPLPQGGFLALTMEKRPAPEDGDECVVYKLNADLSQDSTFGTGGSYKTPKATLPATVPAADALKSTKLCSGLAIQPDGKIVIAGWDSVPNFRTVAIAMRITADGKADPTFNSGNLFLHSLDLSNPGGIWFPSRGGGFQGVAIDADGKIVLVGWRAYNTMSTTSVDSRLVRLLANGQLDSSFGTSGISPALDETPTSRAFRLVIQPDGKIIALGCANDSSNSWVSRVVVSRVTTNGQLDATFGTGGRTIVKTTLPDTSAPDVIPQEMLLLADGKLIVTARTGWQHLDPAGFLVARLNADGMIDTTFAVGGRFTLTMPDASGEQAAQYGNLALAPLDNGRVVLVTHYTSPSGKQGLLVGLDSQGRLDPNFKNAAGDNKIIKFTIGGQPTGVTNVLPQADGKFLVYGAQLRTDGSFLFVARFAGSSTP